MIAVLRTYNGEELDHDTLIHVDDDHEFYDSHADTVPICVGSNQTVLDLEDLTHKELLNAVRNSTIKVF